MKTKSLCAWCILAASVFLASGAETMAWDSAIEVGAQKNSMNMDLKTPGRFPSEQDAPVVSNVPSLEGTAGPYLVSVPKSITYPWWARRQGFKGFLVAALEILPDGSVGKWQILKSTGYELLDKSAAKAFVTWKFQPAMERGKPVATTIRIPINFELTEE